MRLENRASVSTLCGSLKWKAARIVNGGKCVRMSIVISYTIRVPLREMVIELPLNLQACPCLLSNFVLDISHSRNLIQADMRKCSHQFDLPYGVSHSLVFYRQAGTYALLHQLHVFLTHSHPPSSTQMPPRLPFQVLNHDAR